MANDLAGVRKSVLDEMERAEHAKKGAIIAGAILEAVLLGVAVWLLEPGDRFQSMVFVLFILSYMIPCIGLIALGSHVSRSTLRILAALEAGDRDR